MAGESRFPWYQIPKKCNEAHSSGGADPPGVFNHMLLLMALPTSFSHLTRPLPVLRIKKGARKEQECHEMRRCRARA